MKRFPKTKFVATTLREVHNTNAHSWSAVAWVNGQAVQAPTAELKVLDRVGGGDGFAAGFIYGLLNGETPETAVRLRLGARRARHYLPRRHHHGDARSGGHRICRRRIGKNSALEFSAERQRDHCPWEVHCSI